MGHFHLHCIALLALLFALSAVVLALLFALSVVVLALIDVAAVGVITSMSVDWVPKYACRVHGGKRGASPGGGARNLGILEHAEVPLWASWCVTELFCSRISRPN
jgi:hypothetical protein